MCGSAELSWGVVVQSASSELLEQVDALLRCMPRVQPLHGQAMDDPAFLTPDDYTPARYSFQAGLAVNSATAAHLHSVFITLVVM